MAAAIAWDMNARAHETLCRESRSTSRKIDGAMAAGTIHNVKFSASSRPIGITVGGLMPNAVMR